MSASLSAILAVLYKQSIDMNILINQIRGFKCLKTIFIPPLRLIDAKSMTKLKTIKPAACGLSDQLQQPPLHS